MPKQYSIAEARQNLASIVYELDTQPEIELTRRGVPVAMLLSLDAYHQLRGKQPSFWKLYTAFRSTFDPLGLDNEGDAFDGVRDASPGREVQL
jgi:prevent-host-death family protein